MKGINLKKVGAIVAGAAILASSVAFAGLFYDNVELVDDNGQPLVKVVVGSNSKPSDGVVAGNIAARIANEAYATRTLTATAADDVSCSAEAGNSTGTCAVSDEKVTLEVTVPGAQATGVHEFTTLIGDYVDKKLGNRYNARDDDKYSMTESEIDIWEANPFDTETNPNNAPYSDEDLYRIGGDNFVPFQEMTLTDPNTGDTYTEYQFVWLKGTNEFSSADNEVQYTPSAILYQIKFDENSHTGIPVCSEDRDNDKNWANCNTTAAEYVGKHRIQVQFLGSPWVLIEMTPPNAVNLTDDEKVGSGGSVKLAKESVYGIVNVGESLKSKDGEIEIRLDDISTLENVKPAIVSFLDANGNVISQDQISPGDTVKKTINGKTYKVRVYQTAPGYTFGAKWAEMALLEDELELVDGDTLDSDNNEDWYVSLLWKNKEGEAGAEDPDALRSIILYRTSFGDSLSPGDSINVAEDPFTAWTLTYNGFDVDTDTLRFQTGGSVSLSMEDGNTCALPTNSYVKITTQVDDGFRYSGNAVNGKPYTGRGKEVYVVVDNSSTDFDCSFNGTAATPGNFLMKKSGSNKYIAFNGTSADIEYKTAGTSADTNDGGAIKIAYNSGASTNETFSIYEDIGKLENDSATDDHAVGIMSFRYNVNNTEFRDNNNGDNDQITFEPEADGFSAELDVFGYADEGSPEDFDEGKFISPRGSTFESMSSSQVTFKIAKELAHPQYSFATLESQGTSPNTVQCTLAEGEECTVQSPMGDVVVKAVSIDQTVGACSATGGTATCTVPKDQVNAVIMPDNKQSVDAAVPYSIAGQKLVVLDTDASALSTGVIITVGGDKVNSVTADAIAGANIDFTATPVVVEVIGNKIVVAGLTAEDTVTAGDQFLSALQRQ